MAPSKSSLSQTDVLAMACSRRNGSILPLPGEQDVALPKIAKLVQKMLAADLVEERPTTSVQYAWRCDEAGKRFMLRVMQAGRDDLAHASSAASPHTLPGIAEEAVLPKPSPETKLQKQPRGPNGKLGRVLSAVLVTDGASISELAKLTGWQAHTIRASLTRLRQTGISICLAEHKGQKRYVATQASPASAP